MYIKQVKINQNRINKVKSFFGVVCLGTFALIMQSCELDDRHIHQEITRVLSEDYPNISCQYEDGVVLLTGTVCLPEDKLKAERCIRKIRYVRAVRNNLAVDHTQPLVSRYDHTIQSRITRRLMKEGCKEIDVKVKNGIVTLSGQLQNQDLLKVMEITNESNPRQIRTNIVLINK